MYVLKTQRLTLRPVVSGDAAALFLMRGHPDYLARAGGMEENKVVRVVGLSSAVLMDKANPTNPINRRISIIVMNKRAEEAASRDGGTVKVGSEGDVAPVLEEHLPAAAEKK